MGYLLQAFKGVEIGENTIRFFFNFEKLIWDIFYRLSKALRLAKH